MPVDTVPVDMGSPTAKGTPGTPTSPGEDRVDSKKCVVKGEGLLMGATGEESTFTIEARDMNGARRSGGGDAFFVHIRGIDKVRAKVTDTGNGLYHVSWKPYTSGDYTISVSHFGEPLPGSPFKVYVYHPRPHAPNCTVSGKALHDVRARDPATFSVQFKDKLGQVASATELDVFVELLEAAPRPEPLQGFEPPTVVESQSSLLSLGSPTEARRVHFDPDAPEPTAAPSPHLVRVRALPTQSERAIAKMRMLDWSKAEKVMGGGEADGVVLSERLQRISQLAADTATGGGEAAAAAGEAGSPGGESTTSEPSLASKARLDVHSRNMHKQLWFRRGLVDKWAQESSGGIVLSRGNWGYREKSAQLHELDVDPTGFARGEAEPGTLKAHGELFESHKVPFSVGLAGEYHLHVRLRQEALPLPGSPFRLRVTAGPASGYCSFLVDDIHTVHAGRVCTATVQTCDVMGNACTQGGAIVACSSTPKIDFKVSDMDDGSYEIEFRAIAGQSEIEIKVGGMPITGSPFLANGGKEGGRGGRRGSALAKLDDFQSMLKSDKGASPPKSPERSPGGSSKGGHKPSARVVGGVANIDKSGSFRGRSSGLATKPATVPQAPVMSTRKRMSLGMSGMELPDSIADDPLAMRAVQAATSLYEVAGAADPHELHSFKHSFKKQGDNPRNSLVRQNSFHF